MKKLQYFETKYPQNDYIRTYAGAVELNTTKKRNRYIMSPMKIPKQQFYNFCMKFSMAKHHRRRNFPVSWLREGRKWSGKFTAYPDYTFYRLWILRLFQRLFLIKSRESQQKFKYSFPLPAARNWENFFFYGIYRY